MSSVESDTALVILRGDTASGKSSTAVALRSRIRGKTALIEQDYYRWRLFEGGDKHERALDSIPVMEFAARRALEAGYSVIIEGVLNRQDNASWLGNLYASHSGPTVFCQFDVGLEETLRRHTDRPASTLFGEQQIRDWYDGWNPLPYIDELRIPKEDSLEEVVSAIAQRLRGIASF